MRTQRLSPDKYLTPTNIQVLREHAAALWKKRKSYRSSTDRLIVEILVGAGLRAQELCDIDLQDLPFLKDNGQPEIYVRCGKGGVAGSVDISSLLVGLIVDYVTKYRSRAAATDPLFVGRTNKRLHYRVLYEKIKKLGRECGLTIAPHKLRRSYGVWAYSETRDIMWVKNQLRHSSVATTMIYADTLDTKRRTNAERMK